MEISHYDKIGRQKLKKLISDFYKGVREDEVLKPMYQNDFENAEERLFLFIIQYLGGPETYNQLRGQPKLRIRHTIFPITEQAKQHWLNNMKSALDQSEISETEKIFLWNYFQQTAEFLKNR